MPVTGALSRDSTLSIYRKVRGQNFPSDAIALVRQKTGQVGFLWFLVVCFGCSSSCLHMYKWTKRVRWRTNDVLTMYGVTKGVTWVNKWLKVAGGRGSSTTDGHGWTRIYRRKQSKRRGRNVGTENAKESKTW